jgi:hypothetical protein
MLPEEGEEEEMIQTVEITYVHAESHISAIQLFLLTSRLSTMGALPGKSLNPKLKAFPRGEDLARY